MRRIFALTLVLMAVLPPAAANALEALTLERAVALALERNLTLQASREDYEAAKWGLRGARASLFPSLGLSSTARRVDSETYRRANASLGFAEEFGIEVEPFLYETTYETGFYLKVPIWNGGKIWGAVGAASGGRDAAMYAHESTRRAVVVDARTAYFDVLRAESLLAVQLDAVDAARRNAEAAGRRRDVGLAGRAEFLRWQVMLANEERGLADAEGAVSLARTRLLSVLGLPLDEEHSLQAVPETLLDEAVERYASAVGDRSFPEARARTLLRDNPDFLALSAATRVTSSGVAIARGAFLPSLNATGTYGWKADDDIDPDDETAWSVTLALDLPVFTSFKNLSDYQSSKRSYLAAARRQEDGERALVSALRGAGTGVESSLKALDAARLEREHAAELVKNVRNMYSQGMASYTELADAEVLFGRGSAAAVNALFECLTALAEVERLLGTDTADRTGDDR
ncbi:MAG: TolC family protein [Candidatus Eisenbacteria bacterium]